MSAPEFPNSSAVQILQDLLNELKDTPSLQNDGSGLILDQFPPSAPAVQDAIQSASDCDIKSGLIDTKTSSDQAGAFNLLQSDVNSESTNATLRRFKCDECGKSFSRNENLNIHIMCVHKNQKPFQCPDCDKSFTAKYSLQTHAMRAHGDLRPFKCEICFIAFPRSGYLKRHVQIVHENLRPFKCEICDKTFSGPYTLKNHVKNVHECLKPCKCEICGSSFSQPCNLLLHIASVHKGERPYVCNYCDRRFTTRGNLNRHEASLHKDQIAEQSQSDSNSVPPTVNADVQAKTAAVPFVPNHFTSCNE
ncbi:unnamed protein product [Hymenolepis diminuta]|uniref:Protein krueppel n=1 Tax=Hymenolepis diminuta TaxID=6216 RepID=A0A158QEB1_HYMDI|nr:unnamed protein product [Hymenolepis diminuta]